MKVMYVGDFIKQNGPSMVDISLTKSLDGKLNRLHRVQIDKSYTSDIRQIKQMDIVNLSGASGKGCIYCIIAKLMKKPVSYIMHGAMKVEKQYRPVRRQGKIYEYILTRFSDAVICVSPKFEYIVSENYSIKNLKHVNNGVDIRLDCDDDLCERDIYNILTVGGGRSEKGILNICKAIESIRNPKIKLTVVGENGIDTEKIKEYKFVDYRGFINHEELTTLMKNNSIFIQNSYYEPFGIAPIEAIANGMNVILSNQIGVCVPGSEHYQVDPSNIEELKLKIEELMKDIKGGYSQNVTVDSIKDFTWENSANTYINIWKEL